MGDAYPELQANRDVVVQVVRSEEERFDAVLTAGLPRLEEALDRAAAGITRHARRRGVPAVRLARRAARLHGGPRRPARPRDRSRGLRARDGGPARAGARGQHVRRRRPGTFAFDVDDGRSTRRSRRRRSVRGLRPHVACTARRASRSSTRTARTVDELADGQTRLRRARAQRRSTSNRAARSRTAGAIVGARRRGVGRSA